MIARLPAPRSGMCGRSHHEMSDGAERVSRAAGWWVVPVVRRCAAPRARPRTSSRAFRRESGGGVVGLAPKSPTRAGMPDSRRTGPGADAAREALLLDVVATLFDHFPPEPPGARRPGPPTAIESHRALRRAVARIDTSFHERVTLDRPVRHVGSPGYLSQVFPQQVDTTFSEDLTRVRPRRATRDPGGTGHRIAQFAVDSGFPASKPSTRLPAAPSGARPGLPSPADGRHRRRELGLPPALRLSPRRDNHAGPAHLGLTCHHRRDGLLRDDQGIGSSRNAQEKSLVLRAFLCFRYRRTAPLQQVRARPARMSQGPGARRVLLTGTRTGMSPAAFHRPRSRAPPTCATLACGARGARERIPVHHRAPSALRGRTQSHPVVRKTARSYPRHTRSYATPRGRTLEGI